MQQPPQQGLFSRQRGIEIIIYICNYSIYIELRSGPPPKKMVQ